MKIQPILLSLGITLIPGFAVSAPADDPSASQASGNETAANKPSATAESAVYVHVDPRPGVPPAIILRSPEEDRVQFGRRREPAIHATISPEFPAPLVVAVDIPEPSPEAEQDFEQLASTQSQARLAVARPGSPAIRPLDLSRSRRGADAAIEYGAPPVRVEDPLDLVHNASALIEKELYNAEGEALGAIDDVLIEKSSGRVLFVAAGPDDEMRLIPPQALQPEPEEGRVVLAVDSERWEQAPTTARDDLSRLAQADEAREIYSHFGVPYRQTVRSAQSETAEEPRQPGQLAGDPPTPRSEPPVLQPDRTNIQDRDVQRQFGAARDRTSTREAADREGEELLWTTDLLGNPVQSEAGEDAGRIEDLILDLHIGYVQHIIVSAAEAGGQSFAVPLHEIRLESEGPATLLIDPSQLEDAQPFDARTARLRRYEPFRYDTAAETEFGAPVREQEPPATQEEQP